jgi:hypothetical protein
MPIASPDPTATSSTRVELAVPRAEKREAAPTLAGDRSGVIEAILPGTQRTSPPTNRLTRAIQLAEVPKEKADLMHATYERIVVAGPEIVRVRLTSAAHAHGLALALSEKVAMARPTGFNRADAIYSRIPIEGAGEWRRADILSGA